MTCSASQRSIRSLMRHISDKEKLNILTFTTHERYEYNLCKTGHNFYAINLHGKSWDLDYSPIPENYYILDKIPDYLDIDIILAHTSCSRLQQAHDIISDTINKNRKMCHIPILRHSHVLPDIRFNVEDQKKLFSSVPVDVNSFISKYNMKKWGFSEDNSYVIEHGVDTDFWNNRNEKRQNVCLSIVNDWPNRDWCCGFNLWRETIGGLPAAVFGKSPGFSEPAKSIEHLREIYSSCKIFYNTSLHSPVPTVLLEAMSCGCAVVSTNNCMIPDIIQNGKNGLVSNDPKELRYFLELLLSNDDMATELGNNARKTIEENFNIQKFCKNWDSLLLKTVHENKGIK